MEALMARLSAVEDVDIDDDGVFKYVLIKVSASNPVEEFSKVIVRGYSWAEYHADIYDAASQRIEPLGLDCECLGGGRIQHAPNNKRLKVYGYSMGFGKADHQITCDLLKTKYLNYNITWTDGGY
ncbi:14 kDa phosphohistidine phosphatase-like isoform X2 [Watersipora subatra]